MVSVGVDTSKYIIKYSHDIRLRYPKSRTVAPRIVSFEGEYPFLVHPLFLNIFYSASVIIPFRVLDDYTTCTQKHCTYTTRT